MRPGTDRSQILARYTRELAERIEEIFLAEGGEPSRQRNIAAGQASGEFLYFLDDDSEPCPENFERASTLCADSRVVVLAGPNVAGDAQGVVEEACGVVLASTLGTYKVKARYRPVGKRRPAEESDIILCNLCVRRDAFLEVGGFDERLYPNEENEFFHRLRRDRPAEGLVYDPDFWIHRARPGSVAAYARKIFGYGRGRARQTLVSPAWSELFYGVPLLFLAYLFSLVFLRNPVWLLPLAAYLLLVFAFSARALAVLRKWRVAALLLLLYPMTHIAYALGSVWELVKALSGKKKEEAGTVHIYRAARDDDGVWRSTPCFSCGGNTGPPCDETRKESS